MDGRPENSRSSSRPPAAARDPNRDDGTNDQSARSTNRRRRQPLSYDSLYANFDAPSTSGSTTDTSGQLPTGNQYQQSEPTRAVRAQPNYSARSHPYQTTAPSRTNRPVAQGPHAGPQPASQWPNARQPPVGAFVPRQAPPETTGTFSQPPASGAQPFGTAGQSAFSQLQSSGSVIAPSRFHPGRHAEQQASASARPQQAASQRPPACDPPTGDFLTRGFFDHSQQPRQATSQSGRSQGAAQDAPYEPRRPRNDLLPAMPANAEQQLRALWSDRRGRREVLSVQGVSLTAEETGSLYQGQLLFDSVIDAYLALVLKRLNDDGNHNVKMAPAAISQLCEERMTSMPPADILGFGMVGNLFESDKLFVPYNCCSHRHWTLFSVNFQRKVMKTYDPVGGDRRRSMDNFFNLLVYLYEPLVRTGQVTSRGPLRKEEWRFETARGIPRQTNATDCGIFICQYVNYLCGFAEEDDGMLNSCIQEEDMMYFRQRMALQLLNQQVEMP